MKRRSFLAASTLGALALTRCRGAGPAALDGASTDDTTPGDASEALDAAPPVDLFATLDEAREGFAYGVWAGDAQRDRAVFATRYTGPSALSLRVQELGATSIARVAYDARVEPDGDGYVYAPVSGLTPGARHTYAFVERDRDRGEPLRRSAVGSLRAAFDGGSREPLRFLAVSCTKALYRPFAALGHALGTDAVDFTVHLGDHVYCDGANTLDEYRAKYLENWSDPMLGGWHRLAGAYNTWDDHEVENNFDPETVDRTKLATARRAFFEHNPVARDASAPEKIYRSFRWGETLELFVLDCRSEQRASTRRGPNAEYVSPTQLAWLEEGLARSTATFKIVLTSLPISDFPLPFALSNDTRWEGYAAQRNALLEFIVRESLRGVLFVAGDQHLGALAHVDAAGPYNALYEVLVGPGGQLANPLTGTLTGPQWEFVTGTNSYTEFVLDPAARTVTLRFWAAQGALLTERTLTL